MIIRIFIYEFGEKINKWCDPHKYLSNQTENVTNIGIKWY